MSETRTLQLGDVVKVRSSAPHDRDGRMSARLGVLVCFNPHIPEQSRSFKASELWHYDMTTRAVSPCEVAV